MEAKDKFGNTIYPYIYEKLLDIGNKLENIGFIESAQKPNLFYFNFNKDTVVFADMRGTVEVKIYEEPIPLIYFKLNDWLPLWKQNRIKNEILKILNENQIPYRQSFYDKMDGWIEPHDLVLDTFRAMVKKDDEISEDIFDEYTGDLVVFGSLYNYNFNVTKIDGYCKKCGIDIQKNVPLCERCFNIEYNKRKAKIFYGKYKKKNHKNIK